MFKSILTAAIVSVAVASAALAVPSAPSTSPVASASTDLLQVKASKNYKKGKLGKGHANRRHNKYVAAHKYHYAPNNWHHYSYRPLRWQARGCIVVGALWYCP